MIFLGPFDLWCYSTLKFLWLVLSGWHIYFQEWGFGVTQSPLIWDFSNMSDSFVDFSLLVLVHKYLGCQHPFGGFFKCVCSLLFLSLLISFYLKSILPYGYTCLLWDHLFRIPFPITLPEVMSILDGKVYFLDTTSGWTLILNAIW